MINEKQKTQVYADPDGLPPESINAGLTAQPKHAPGVISTDDMQEEPFNYGESSLEDAKDSGYTNDQGRAVSVAKNPVEGNPTGAYTDIGAGRSSVVKKSEANH